MDLQFTPLFIPYKKPYYWAQGITKGAELILVTLITDKGIEGYGETISTPSCNAILALLNQVKNLIIGKDIYENEKIFKDVYQYLFQAKGTCSAPRFANQLIAGIEISEVVNVSLSPKSLNSRVLVKPGKSSLSASRP